MDYHFLAADGKPVAHPYKPQYGRGYENDGQQSYLLEDLSSRIAGRPHFGRQGTASKYDKIHPNEQWPQTPQPLKKTTGWAHLDIIWEATVTVLPLMFIFLAAAALSLDGKNRSLFGDQVNEASKYGTTIFPIIFAAVVARLMRAIALWRCEAGATLGFLEQVVGSQSLAGTIERFFLLRRFRLDGLLIIVLWALSPIGSQLSLRILQIEDGESVTETTVRYLNTTSPLDSNQPGMASFSETFIGASAMNSYASVLRALTSSSMLSSEDVQQSSMDQWGNLKIPYFNRTSIPEGTAINLLEVAANASDVLWASSIGLMMQGVPARGNTRFDVEASYFDVDCSDSIDLTYDSSSNSTALPSVLRNAGFVSQFVDFSDPWNVDDTWNSLFLETMSQPTGDQPNVQFGPPLNIVFGSWAQNLGSDAPTSDPGTSIEVYNCTLYYPRLRASVLCRDSNCEAIRVLDFDDGRQSGRSGGEVNSRTPFASVTELSVLLGFIPGSLGTPHSGSISAADQFLLGSNAPLSVDSGTPFVPSYSRIPGSRFGRQLAHLLNTVWQAGLSPWQTALGQSANFDAPQTSSDFVPSAEAAATNALPLDQVRYRAHKTNAVLLLLISLFLQGCAFAGLVFGLLTRAPNVLGFVSSMTRDNAFARVPEGGGTLSGLRRARYLMDVRVQLADARPDADVGHIVFCTVQDGSAGGRGDSGYGRLRRNRVYD